MKKDMTCKATVTQCTMDYFTPGSNSHNHASAPGRKEGLKVAADVKKAAE